MNWLSDFTKYVENTVTTVTTVTPAPALGSSRYGGSEATVTSVTSGPDDGVLVTVVTIHAEAPLHGKPSIDGVVTPVTLVTQEYSRPHWDYDPMLEALCADLDPEDGQALRDERAGIMEYQAGFTREDAETMTAPRQRGVA